MYYRMLIERSIQVTGELLGHPFRCFLLSALNELVSCRKGLVQYAKSLYTYDILSACSFMEFYTVSGDLRIMSSGNQNES